MRSGPLVFVRVRAPHRRLRGPGVTQDLVRRGARVGTGRIYAHQLRHTVASEMLRAGASLHEIGQVLRHQHPADDGDLREGRPRRAAADRAAVAGSDAR